MSEIDESQLATALSHSVRRGILRQMHGVSAISPRELSSAMGVDLGCVSYHVRVLAEHGAITLVDTKPVRGSLQHFYRFDIEAGWALQFLDLPAG